MKAFENLRVILLIAEASVAWAANCSSTKGTAVHLDLSSQFNNKAFGTKPGEASFDVLNQSYPAPSIGPEFTSSDTGITYSFPGYTGAEKSDNIICAGQKLPVPEDAYFSASFLVAGDVEGATVSGNVSFTYSDNTTSEYELRTLNWFSFLTINRGEIIFPSRFTPNGSDFNTSHIFERSAALPTGKKLSSITLPVKNNATEGRLHIFAISLWQSSDVSVQSVRPTQKWIGNGTQIVEVTVNNAGSKCVAGDGLNVTLSGNGYKTVRAGYTKRLCPGDQKVIAVGVEGSSEGPSTAVVELFDGATRRTTSVDLVEVGLKEWTPDLDSLSKHESPDWFDEAKYGIFIHWGPYSVAGWGNSTPYESYAEWFWWYSTHHPEGDRSNFYGYRLETYGPEWAYDDTFPEFTASKFDAKEWVDLFADAGAKYFVITTKHHDGFAIFDAGQTSNRSAIHYGPKRDLLKELFNAAETHQPSLKRGTYFSLPEWFNPDFGPYGFVQFPTPEAVSWPGTLAPNPYTGEPEPYTGHVPVEDFIADLMVPQMETLAFDYKTDIMWCDCGAANGTAAFAANWWNKARAEDRQVAINSRCGIPEAADFDTPEYQTIASAQRRKWESNRGMDPYSYGYNRATKPEEYMNASTIVYSLVDMVSKNGNFLLDIGPRADGTIVQAEMDNLREAGKWIKAHGEAIFNTTYWFIQSEIIGGPEVRFTQTDEAFYAIFLEKPKVVDGWVSIAAPIPIVDGDVVSLLGVGGGTALEWKSIVAGDSHELKVKIDEALIEEDEFGWVFKVLYV
ncbi:glycoside hydrolase family 29 protein [Colletotrichum truncatum]|uniref:Glycoside hydrolase family 29 protein n=1 Tax=Colletotrichum truncatum TaxID=5467 RepID=A0ACC3YVM8_COLTU|nr:glycoside hydrolase family 29 protein [Colletotrichum truncatum]KAF6791295.1 glycoside hydrolase family 29 protein [Colletotrichum truncatum]